MITIGSSLKSLMNLSGRHAVITGATGCLGRVICETLAELGASLVLVDKPGAMFEQVERPLREKYHVDIQCIACDLEEQVQRKELLKQLIGSFPAISILVNNAAFVGTSALSGWAVPFAEQSVETWRRAIEVNLTASFELCQGLTVLLSKAAGATIINVGSIYGTLGPDWQLYEGTAMSNPAAYGASKGGLIQLTKWLATTLAPNIRVNAISPGGIYRAQPNQFVEKYIARTPLARMAKENDFRGSFAFLASDLSSYMTGQNLVVDGGFSVW